MKLKKAAIVLSVLLLVLSLTACGASPVGSWKTVSVYTGVETLTVKQVPELAIDVGDILLEKGGTGTMMRFNSPYKITWDDNYIYFRSDKLPYTLKGDSLLVKIDSWEYTFARK